jgi:peptidoglycan hydrolase-like protein with peptidoglycan-binding domain
MDLREVQTRLKAMQLYGGEVDGKYGPLSKAAIEALFVHQQVTGFGGWNAQRRIVAAGQSLCRIDGIETGRIDGLLGPQTRHAFEVYDARQRGDTSAESWRDTHDNESSLVAPLPAATTWPRQRDCTKFYGPVGSNQVSITIPYPLKLAWDKSKTLNKITCHKKVAEPTRRVLERVLTHYGLDEIRKLRLDLFGGSLNVRKMRGGSAWSMHAWGIAFDFDPERNQLKWSRPKAAFSAAEYKPWFNAWSAEGAIGLGPARDYDWMHTQFARL